MLEPAIPKRALALLALAVLSIACRDRPAPAPPPQPSASARDVQIESAPPGAQVVVTGLVRLRCATPCAVKLEPGPYRVAFRMAGYLPLETDFTVGFTGEARLSASLVASH
ncbi:MAG TPA: PEGA domain-containing protein [Anaeromyxobacteraceae bacterium]|jgi:hypothetical protein